MRLLAPAVALVWLIPVGHSQALDASFKSNEIPKSSELHNQLSFEVPDKDIREKILKLIPLGTSEADAKLLFQKHMPRKAQEKFNEGGGAHVLPENLRHKPYICYRLLTETDFLHLGSQWAEALFFFEDGKLVEVYIARGSVSI
jgi:hypothetical protein